MCKYEYRPPHPNGANASRPSAAPATNIFTFSLNQLTRTAQPSAMVGGGGCDAHPLAQVRYAVVLRGEPFRWGCSSRAVERQLEAAGSVVAYATALEEGGRACVDVYAAMSSAACDVSAREALETKYGKRLKASRVFKPAADQGRAVVDAMHLYLEHSGRGHDFIVLCRHDLKLISSPSSWGCGHKGMVGIASRCEPRAWQAYRWRLRAARTV